jgi:hypothetical protein
VAALTGAHRATYTTGPATRQALAAAGAHGATTGSVVHLPAAPTAVPGPLLGVVAHELTHTRSPVSRPRFLLEVPHGGADEDERAALAVGRRFTGTGVATAATVGAIGSRAETVPAGTVRAGIVDQLPVGGLGRVTGALSEAREATGGGPTGAAEPSEVDPPAVPASRPTGGALPEPATHAGGGTVDAATGTASHPATQAMPGGAPPPSTVDIDRLADLLEQRLLRQIERRGGRYAGVF